MIWESNRGVCVYQNEAAARHEVRFHPSTNWAQGGLIIEREKIDVFWLDDLRWVAMSRRGVEYSSHTPLVAIMQCYVASRLGYHVDVPNDLLATRHL